MKKCSGCGQEVTDEVMSCPYCGRTFTDEGDNGCVNNTDQVTPPKADDKTTVCTLALVLGIVGFFINPFYAVSLAALILGIIGHVNNGSKKNLAIAGWILAIVSFIVSIILDICTMGVGIFC